MDIHFRTVLACTLYFNTRPFCFITVISCAEPEAPVGGEFEAYDYNVHSTIDFHCEKGHKLVGESSLTCQTDGEWSGESPKCECKYLYIPFYLLPKFFVDLKSSYIEEILKKES